MTKTPADVLRIVRRNLLNGLGEIEAELGYYPTTAQLWEHHKKRPNEWRADPQDRVNTEKAPAK